jgi:hypothetical protein
MVYNMGVVPVSSLKDRRSKIVASGAVDALTKTGE